MSTKERTGTRDLLYSNWHRTDSTRRYLSLLRATQLTAIDIDWCEYCCICSTPIALIEAQESRRGPKPARVTCKLAAMANLPVFSVSFTANEDRTDIISFAVKQLWPIHSNPETLEPADYAQWLESLRLEHYALRSQNGRCAA